MTQTDGEKELILGNKQLISLFFVVVALCGVFFAMGYMIGHNAVRPAEASPDASFGTSAPTGAPIRPTQEAEPPRETATAENAPSTAPLVTTPAIATPGATSEDTSSASAGPSTTVRTQPVHETTTVPQAGATYLQVTALRRADADNLVRTLREQNFPALVAESSKTDLFRVLVGPYHQMTEVADAKARLKTLGFGNAFVQK